MTNTSAKRKKLDINFIYLLYLGIISILILYLVGIYDEFIYEIFPINPFLHWHTGLEFVTIIISFTLFIITYYTYTKNSRLRLLFFSAIFFIVGVVDFLHTMNYNGMQGFFSESSIAKATTFWMISRLIMSFGLLIACSIPYNKKSNINRKHILFISIIISTIIFYLGTFKIEVFPVFFLPGVGLTKTKVYLEYLIMLFFTGSSLFALRDYKKTGDRVFIIFSAGLSLAVFTEAAFTLYKSVYDTYNLLGHIYKIGSSYLIFRAIFLYNLDIPYKQLREARIKLKSHADSLEGIVEARTKEIRNTHQKMMEDLEYARLIQQSLLPPKELVINNVRFISDYIPCQSLSGDLYQFYKIDKDHIGMYIADVSGHGISAAMLMVFTERLMNPAYRTKEINEEPSPERTLNYIFSEFNKANFPDEMHIVAFKAIYNVKTSNFLYCSGGMNTTPILLRSTGEIFYLDKSKGFPICKFDTFFKPDYQAASLHLSKGDRIIFFTDGLSDGFKDSGVFNDTDLIKLVEDNKFENTMLLEANLQKEIRRITNQKANEDDITYFIMEIM